MSFARSHSASFWSNASLTCDSNRSASRLSSSRELSASSAAARASWTWPLSAVICASSAAFCSCSCVIFAFCAEDMARCIRSIPPIASSLLAPSVLASSNSASREMDLDLNAASSTEDGFAASVLASASSFSSAITRLRSAADSIGEVGAVD